MIPGPRLPRWPSSPPKAAHRAVESESPEEDYEAQDKEEALRARELIPGVTNSPGQSQLKVVAFATRGSRKIKTHQQEIKSTTSESVQNPNHGQLRVRPLSVPFPCAPRPYRSLTNKTQFQHVFKVESLLQISNEFSLLAPSVKSHARDSRAAAN